MSARVEFKTVLLLLIVGLFVYGCNSAKQKIQIEYTAPYLNQSTSIVDSLVKLATLEEKAIQLIVTDASFFRDLKLDSIRPDYFPGFISGTTPELKAFSQFIDSINVPSPSLLTSLDGISDLKYFHTLFAALNIDSTLEHKIVLETINKVDPLTNVITLELSPAPPDRFSSNELALTDQLIRRNTNLVSGLTEKRILTAASFTKESTMLVD